MNIEEFEETLQGISELEDGWDYGKGAVPSKEIIECVRKVILRVMNKGNLPWPDVFPTPEGTIRAVWGLEERNIDVEAEFSPSAFTVIAYDSDHEIIKGEISNSKSHRLTDRLISFLWRYSRPPMREDTRRPPSAGVLIGALNDPVHISTGHIHSSELLKKPKKLPTEGGEGVSEPTKDLADEY
jgi:hypothetical protein